ncbi:MAG: hypothetical protein IKW45_05335 [Clostridia bacterium]|nr:hypothetical protein [Clostridia bacterium]
MKKKHFFESNTVRNIRLIILEILFLFFMMLVFLPLKSAVWNLLAFLVAAVIGAVTIFAEIDYERKMFK